MSTSTRGKADIIFCIDGSASMGPCFGAVTQSLGLFLEALNGPNLSGWDVRLDYVVHSAGAMGGGTATRLESINCGGVELIAAVAGSDPSRLFTRDVNTFKQSLAKVHVEGDEDSLKGLDLALDFPWRARSEAHRVVIFLTDESLEDSLTPKEQLAAVSEVSNKVQALGVLLFMVAPASDGYYQLSETDKAMFQPAGADNDGLRSIDFSKLFGTIGKSLSAATLHHGSREASVKRDLFGMRAYGNAGNVRLEGR